MIHFAIIAAAIVVVAFVALVFWAAWAPYGSDDLDAYELADFQAQSADLSKSDVVSIHKGAE